MLIPNECSDKMVPEKGPQTGRASNWNGNDTPGMQISGNNGLGSKTFIPGTIRIIPIISETSMMKGITLGEDNQEHLKHACNQKQEKKS